MSINKGNAHYMGWYTKLKKNDLATFGVSEKGWSNEELGLRWLKEVFDAETQQRWTPPIYCDKGMLNRVWLCSAGTEYRLLILDGHTSHFKREFFDYCLNGKILPLCLPAHSTHLLQPLDVGLFGPLQRHYSNGLDSFIRKGNAGMNKGEFLPLVIACWPPLH